MVRFFAMAAVALSVTAPVFAQQDIRNAQDHPLVSRYAGSRIVDYRVSDFNEFEYPTGPSDKGRPPMASVEGQITTIVYKAASTTDSVPQVYDNFVKALEASKLERVYTCSNAECGPDFAIRAFGWSRRWYDYQQLNILNIKTNFGYELAYWVGRHEVEGRQYIVSVLISQNRNAKQPVLVAVDVVEERPAARGRVTANPAADLSHAVAQEVLSQAKDVAGAKDHPLLSRYPDTFISQYTVNDHQVFEYATGPRAKGQRRPPLASLAGRVTTIVYETRSKRESVAQVYANYQEALERAGAKPVFSCANNACGPAFPVALFTGGERTASYSAIDMYNQTGDKSDDYRYWVGQLQRPDGPIYIGVYVTSSLSNPGPVKIAIDIVEPKDMKSGQVVLDADALIEAMRASGRVVIEGLYFAHDKAELEDASVAAMTEIATFMERHPQVEVFIVGHTDAAGSHSHNMALSQARAEAVTDGLTREFGIKKTRLTAVGVGAVAPVMGNDSEPGRAKNRRVEMVLAGTKALD